MTPHELALELIMFPDQVVDPELFLKKLYAIETHEDRAEVLAMMVSA
jgi:hypothetical protein